MGQTVSKRKINLAAKTEKHAIDRDLWGGKIQAEINGLVPTVFIGQVSARRWFVGWNYQPKDAKHGDEATVPHADIFISPVTVYKEFKSIILDGSI